MNEQNQRKNLNLDEILERIKRKFEDFRYYGEECLQCKGDQTFIYNIEDRAFSIHYIDCIANFICSNCGYQWAGQYGYKGLA